MTNEKHTLALRTFLLVTLLVASLLLVPQVFAQGQGSGGSGGSGSGSGSGDQAQDRDRVQDPTTHDGDEPIRDRDRDQLQDGSGDNCINDGDCDGIPDQDRLQTQDRDRLQDGTGDGVPDQDRDRDRDRLRDPSLHIGDEPIQDQDQLRDRLRDQLEDPDQDRDRDRIRANDSSGLQEVITTSGEVSNDVTNGLQTEIRELARNRNRVEVGVMALIASQNMIGQEGGAIANLAQEIHSVHRTMIQEEEQVQSRGFLSRFFFGGDSDRAATIQNQLQQNKQRMEQIRQYLSDCDCDEQVRTMLQEQIQAMEEEHARLREVAEDEVSTWGLFSWRF